MKRIKFPTSAHSYGVSKYHRTVKLNRYFVARAMEKWKKATGREFHGKILDINANGFCCALFDYKNVRISHCDIRSLFHELAHSNQQSNGCRLKGHMWDLHYWLLVRYGNEIYFRHPVERAANKESQKFSRKIKALTLN